MNYLTYFSCWSWFWQVHRASTEGKLRKEGNNNAKHSGRRGHQHGYLAAFGQVAFKFTPTPVLPRCLSNTFLQSKEKPCRRNLTHYFYLWLVFVCSITHYGKCRAWANCHLYSCIQDTYCNNNNNNMVTIICRYIFLWSWFKVIVSRYKRWFRSSIRTHIVINHAQK